MLIADEGALDRIDPTLLEEGWMAASEPMDFPDGVRLHRRLKRIADRLHMGKISSVQSVVSKHRRGVGVDAKSWKKVQDHENLG